MGLGALSDHRKVGYATVLLLLPGTSNETLHVQRSGDREVPIATLGFAGGPDRHARHDRAGATGVTRAGRRWRILAEHPRASGAESSHSAGSLCRDGRDV